MIWTIWLLLLMLCIFYLTRRDKKMVLLYNQLRCDTAQWPIIGHLHKFVGNSENIVKVLQSLGQEATSKGGLIGLWRINVLYLVVSDAVITEYVLKYCLEKDDIVKLTWVLFGNASIFAPVQVWRPRRKLLSSVFKPKKIMSFVDIFSKQSNVLVNKLQSLAGKGPVSVWEYLSAYAMDAVCESTIGIEVNTQENSNHQILVAMKEIFQVAVERASKPWYYNDFLFTKLHPKFTEHKKLIYDFIEKLIEDRRKFAETQATDPSKKDENSSKSFLDMMIEATDEKEGYSNLALQEELLLLIVAGTDTSAVGTAFTILMLSKYPHVQAKLYQEIYEVFGNSDRAVAAEDLTRLKYLDAVVKESLRLYPPGPFIVRKVDSDVTLPTGITLVKGCSLIINIFSLHRNPQYWGPDADEFRPERFLEAPLLHQAAFIPFSYGPRACIGSQYAYMSMKTSIAHILRRFQILPASDLTAGQAPAKPLKLKYEIMMRDVDNYIVRLENRYYN